MLSIKALGMAISAIINVMIVVALYLFILGIIGINYFKGRYYECHTQLLNNVQTKWDCLNAGGYWNKMFLNFDDIFNAM